MKRAMIAGMMTCLVLAACGRSGGESRPGTGAGELPWAPHLRALDEALVQRKVLAAEQAWYGAYTAALGSRGWEGMLAAGDAALRIGRVAGLRKPYEARARETYLSALFRARAQRSVEGVLRVAEAFSMLGDREVVDQCLVIAGRVVAQIHEKESRERAATLVERFTVRLRGLQSAEAGLF